MASSKTINKLLLRNKGSYLFGKRAWLRIRVAPEAFPVPRPPRLIGLTPEEYEGDYKTKDGGNIEFGVLWGHFHHIEEDNAFHVEQDINGVCRWWEIKPTGPEGEVLEITDQHKEWLEAHIARYDWEQKWIHMCVPMDVPFSLAPYYDAVNYSKTTNFQEDDDGTYLIDFVVKWFYPERRKGFCSSLAKWTKRLSRDGIKFRIFKGVS